MFALKKHHSMEVDQLRYAIEELTEAVEIARKKGEHSTFCRIPPIEIMRLPREDPQVGNWRKAHRSCDCWKSEMEDVFLPDRKHRAEPKERFAHERNCAWLLPWPPSAGGPWPLPCNCAAGREAQHEPECESLRPFPGSTPGVCNCESIRKQVERR